MIKGIIFDFGGVLFVNGTKKFIAYVSKKYNIDAEKVKGIIDGGIGSLYREAKITREEFWQRALKELKIKANIETLEKEWISGYQLITETRDLINELGKKYKIYYVSDNAKELSEQLNNRHNFRSWFESGILAYEAGVRKPNPKIYQMLIEKANINPSETIYIDDKEDNLLPPKEMGMQTLLFETPQKLREKLVDLSIL